MKHGTLIKRPATCEDCPQPGVVGLNGSWVCVVHFNDRVAKEE